MELTVALDNYDRCFHGWLYKYIYYAPCTELLIVYASTFGGMSVSYTYFKISLVAEVLN